MAATNSSIQPLPVEAQLQLKSSAALHSLNDAIIGLVQNSLDAQAQRIHIEIDYLKGNCCVDDDGVGIPAAEFEAEGGLGLMHYTSKFTNSNETHGHHGRFLASLSASSLSSISSRHALSEQSESTIVYHHSRVLTRQLNVSPIEQKVTGRNGTRVVVRDLFGNLAVRMKQRVVHFGSIDHVEKELDRLRLQIAAVALAWPQPVRIVVSDQQAQQKRKFAMGTRGEASQRGHERLESQRTSNFRLDHICTILSQAGYITPADFDSWTSVSARTSQMFVRAAISHQPAPSKQLQFISLGIHPLNYSSALSQVLYREVNILFADSAFGAIEDDLDVPEEERLRRLKDRRFKNDGPTGRQLKGQGKGADRWPMFYIRIDPRDSNLPRGFLRSDEDDRQAAQFLEKTVQLIRSTILQFLKERHFRPRASRHRSGVQSTDKRCNVAESGSKPLTESRCPTQSTEGGHQIPRDHTKKPDLSSVKLVSNEGQWKPPSIPSTVPFASWSRIKSGKPRALEDLLSGLPRGRLPKELERSDSNPLPCKNDTDVLTEEHVNEDVQLLLRDLGDDADNETGNHESVFEQKAEVAPQSRVPEHHEEPCAAEHNDSDDGIIVWNNPISGKSIRINSRTGLSVPDLPRSSTSEPQSSTSKLSASLLRNTLASARNPRIDCHQSDLHLEPEAESNSWLSSLLTRWQNPVFRLKEGPIPSMVVEHDDTNYAKAHKFCHGKYHHCTEPQVASRDGRLSKVALADANVLGQVDKKFILAIMGTLGSETGSKAGSDFDDTALVLIDQHAADERCRVEELYAEISKFHATTTRLPKPIIFEVTDRESELFRREGKHFEAWGIIYDLDANNYAAKQKVQAVRPASARPLLAQMKVEESPRRPVTATASTTSATLPVPAAPKHSRSRVIVHTLPHLIAERCRLDPKLLINILRSEVWARTENPTHRPSTLLPLTANIPLPTDIEPPPHPWLHRISTCPRGIIDLLNSRACRSAIMFNDELTKPECEELIRVRLARCAFPFQCAHGRPSMVVLGRVQGDGLWGHGEVVGEGRALGGMKGEGEAGQEGFLTAFKTWQGGR